MLTCGTISGGYGYNIIPDSVNIVGTCRSFTPQMQALMKGRMGAVCCGVAHTYGGNIDLDYQGNCSICNESIVHSVFYLLYNLDLLFIIICITCITFDDIIVANCVFVRALSTYY